MMCLMYFACLRVGEVAWSSHGDHILGRQQVHFSIRWDTNKPTSMTINFHSFKDSNGQQPSHRRPPNQRGPLLLTEQGTPMNRTFFVGKLKSILAYTNLSYLNINSHSFRVGRTTDMVMQGHSDTYIQKVGRWSSNAYRVCASICNLPHLMGKVGGGCTQCSVLAPAHCMGLVAFGKGTNRHT